MQRTPRLRLGSMAEVRGAGSLIRDVRRMKAFVTSGVLLLLLSGCSQLQPAQRGVATVEFERQENNASVNIVPCTLVLSDHQTITLCGGERAVVSVSPGSFYVTAFSIDPYSAHSGARAWRSPRTRFHVASGERLRVFVEPASSGSTYTRGWSIHAPKIAAPNRRLRLGLVPWSLEPLTSQGSAVGELWR